MAKNIFEIIIECERSTAAKNVFGFSFCVTTTKDEEKLYWWLFKLMKDNNQPFTNIKIKKVAKTKYEIQSEKEIEERLKEGYK